MAKIVDPDQLNQGTEVTFDTSTKKITLSVAGNLNDDSPGKSSGVTHQAVYSFAKEEWLADSLLQSSRFPFLPIFEAKFDWINNWQNFDQQTFDLIRDSGFRVVLNNNEYAGIISLQTIDDSASDLAYYWQVTGWEAPYTSFDKTGELDEPILIYDGTTDYRDFLKVALRVQAKTYGYGNLLIDQGLSALTYQAYRLPVSNTVDSNIDVTDSYIENNTPYTNIELTYLKGVGFRTWSASVVYPVESVVLDAIRQASGSANGTWWFSAAGGTSSNTGTADDAGVTDWEQYIGEEQIGDEWFAFNRVFTATSGTPTAKQFYNKGMYNLRHSESINSDLIGPANQRGYGLVTGSVAMELMDYVGTTLRTKPGVLFRNFDANDTNSIQLSDITVDGDTNADDNGLDQDDVPETTTVRTFPFVSAGNITFSDNLTAESDVDTIYTMYFQYSTRDTATDVALVSGSVGTGIITSATINFTDNFSDGDYLQLSGFSNGVNNGIFQASGSVGHPTANEMFIRKVTGATLINEAAGATVNVDANPYDSPDAIIVNNNAGTPITGEVTASSIGFDFDYDGNVQGGRTSGATAPVAIFTQGKSGAQWVDGTFNITNTTGLSFPLNAADERVYANP